MNTRKAIPAIVTTAVLTATPLAIAADILPRRPIPQPTFGCGPNIPANKATAALVPGEDGSYLIYTGGKQVAVVRRSGAVGIVWCATI